MPKVSIIVPCWGVEKYLDRCVESLVNQTLKDIEIILVDDVSPDRVPQMCDSWSVRDNRVRVVHKEKNEGLGFARNSGLEVATGEYLMFVDSDDTIELDTCKRLYNAAKKYDADIVTGNFNTEYMPGQWHKKEQPEGQQVLRGEEVRQYMLDMIATAPHIMKERLYPVSVCLLCIRRSIIEAHHLWFMSEREVASEDTVFKASLLQHCKVLVREPYAFYKYYCNGGSLTTSFSFAKYKKLKDLHRILSKQLAGDKEALSRIDRFIISDTRPHVQRLIASDTPNKMKVLKEMLDDELWTMVSGYAPSNFPPYQRIFYALTLGKHAHLLYLYAKFISILKQIRK